MIKADDTQSNSALSQHRIKIRHVLLLIGVFVAIPAVIKSFVRRPRAEAPVPNQIILISIDTLRADHLGYAGYERATSPRIDRVAEDSVVFLNAFSHSNATLPSHATLFTSLYPSVHRANTVLNMPLADGFDTLAEILRDRGFRTAAFVEGGQLNTLWNLDQGFETYEVINDYEEQDSLDRILEAASRWIEKHRDEPFFCFVHSYVVHVPYWPRPPFDRMFVEGDGDDLPAKISMELVRSLNEQQWRRDDPMVAHAAALYDGEIRYMDGLLGGFIDDLHQSKILQKAIIVFTSDHGEEFAEHGTVARHGHHLHDELLRVPLFFHGPGLKPRRIDRQVRLIDVAPTVLGLLQMNTGELSFQGTDLFGDGAESGDDLPLLAEALYPTVVWSAVRTDGFKLHAGSDNRFLAFDLSDDPAEQNDIFGQDPDRDNEWIIRMEELKDEALRLPVEVARQATLDPETEKQLRALGYIK